MMPTVTLVGRLGRDLELRFTPGGLAVANTSMALQDRVKQADGSWADGGDPWWVTVTLWRSLAENAVESGIGKGDLVVATGRLKEETWTDKEGVEHKRVNLVADEFSPSLRYAVAKVERVQRTVTQPTDTWGERPEPPQDDEPPF